jgi:uncharacterized repeat protein (TIGR01451 family)
MFPAVKMLALCLAGASLTAATAAHAAQPSPAAQATSEARLTGLWMTTDFPVLTQAIGDDISIGLQMENRNLPPQAVKLDVTGLPAGWTWDFRGNGVEVGGVMVRPDQMVDLTLDVAAPADAKPGTYNFRVKGNAGGQTFELPLYLTLAAAAEARVTLEPKLPALRGTPRSTFDFQVTATNESKQDEVFNLLAQLPPGFEASFKELYGSNELTSIPIKAGEKKDLKVTVSPPDSVAAGQYPVKVAVASPNVSSQTDLLLDITGQPTLSLEGPEGRLSGDATAGRERSFTFTLSNTGTAPAKDVKLSTTPPSEWKVTFAPETIPEVKPGEKVDVAVNMTPSDKAIAGDYMVNVRVNGEGSSDTAAFRVTVTTSTVWGIAGLGIIGASLAVFAGAVSRYGRR